MTASDLSSALPPDSPDAALHSGGPPPQRLPSGAVTFLYTDIAGSTERWERAPDAMRAALLRHHALLRAAITSNQGAVYQIIGDAFVAVFTSAAHALAAALAAQRALLAEPWPDPVAPLRVRMALHYGSGHYHADGYHAEESLNRLFRLLSAGFGGQILLTGAVYELLAPAGWPPGVSARDLGSHRLRDLTTRLRVWQVLAPGLPSDFPPLRSLSHHPNNLPAQATELYGREDAIAGVAARLRQPQTRQLTLTGLGGIGKTRLALAAAAELLPDFPDGVFVAALDQVQEAGQVAPALAALLGVRDAGEQPLAELLAAYLQPKRLLLVLDNCEHVLAAAPLAAALLQAAPQLKLLATSRVPLGLYGEQEVAVEPLAVPPARAEPEALGQNPAVQLFAARARAVAPQFSLSAANAAAVAAICVRLEGLPLAIELAAAQARALPPAIILDRLTDRLDFLSTRSRDGPDRRQTLRATLAWSYELLGPEERRLLAWLSVFVGGASLEAAAALWEGQGLDVVEGLLALVRHGLVQPQLEDEAAPRYRLLELVRDYAGEQLAARPEADIVALRHAAYFRGFVAANGTNVTNDPAVRERIAQEYPNIRAALHAALARREAELALGLASPLTHFWYARGAVREGWALARAVLDLPLPPGAPGELWLQHAQTQARATILANALGEYAHGRALIDAATSTARAFGDDQLLASCLSILYFYLDKVADYAQCLASLNQALEIQRGLKLRGGMATSHLRLGAVEAANGFFPAAQAHYIAALAGFRETNHLRGISAALNNLGGILIIQEDYAAAEGYLADALAISYAIGEPYALIMNLLNLSSLALYRSDTMLAQECLSHALQLAEQHEQPVLTVYVLGFVGWLAQVRGQLERAACFMGAYELRLEQIEYASLTDFGQKHLQAARARVQAQLGEAGFSAAYGAGQQLSVEGMIAAAREIVGVPDLDESGRPLPLTLPLAAPAAGDPGI